MRTKLVSKYQKSQDTLETLDLDSITSIKLLYTRLTLILISGWRKSQSLVSYYNSETSETNEIMEILGK